MGKSVPLFHRKIHLNILKSRLWTKIKPTSAEDDSEVEKSSHRIDRKSVKYKDKLLEQRKLVKQLMSENSKLKSDNDSYIQKIKSFGSRLQKCESKSSEITSKLEKELSAAITEINNLKTELETEAYLRIQLEKENNELSEELSKTQKEFLMLQEKISKSEIELMNSTDEFSKLQHEFSKSQQELSKLGQELSQSRQECLKNGSYQELYNILAKSLFECKIIHCKP